MLIGPRIFPQPCMGFGLCEAHTIKWPWAIFWHGEASDKYPVFPARMNLHPSKDHLASRGYILTWWNVEPPSSKDHLATRGHPCGIYPLCRRKFIAWCLTCAIRGKLMRLRIFAFASYGFWSLWGPYYKTALCLIPT